MPAAIQNALIEVLGVPTDDFFQIHHVLPRYRHRHTSAFLGQEYSDDMILLELTLVVLLYEIAGENASVGSGLAQRAHIATQS